MEKEIALCSTQTAVYDRGTEERAVSKNGSDLKDQQKRKKNANKKSTCTARIPLRHIQEREEKI